MDYELPLSNAAFLLEYEKLKEEQASRIGFRDNLLYFTLAAFGALGAFYFGEDNLRHRHYALLVLPWVSIVLGWTYLMNDEKVTAIGKYIREVVRPALPRDAVAFGWEEFHRADDLRTRRKFEQLIVDELTFCVSSLFALTAFHYADAANSMWAEIAWWGELALTVILGVEILMYSQAWQESRLRRRLIAS